MTYLERKKPEIDKKKVADAIRSMFAMRGELITGTDEDLYNYVIQFVNQDNTNISDIKAKAEKFANFVKSRLN